MEHKVARDDELREGELREVQVAGKKVLLLRCDGVVRAFGARCPHYDGPLAKGLLHDGRLVCPWHQGTFDAGTGDLLEPPPLSGLSTFAVRLDGGDVYVDRPDDAPRQRTMPMAGRDPRDERTFAVIGGGAAGAAAVEALRQNGFTGRIVLLCREERRPYDRPNLSKDYLAGKGSADWLPLRPVSFYERHDIELVHTGVTSLEAPGAELPGVFTLRSWSDCDAVIAAVAGAARAIVIGASFIAMETAAALRERGLEVTVVAPDETPLAAQLGREVGELLRARHEERGVRFALGRTIARFEGDQRVRAAQLDDGRRLEADLVVVGVGVTPATAFVVNAARSDDGGLDVDDELRVNDNGVWAAGDVACYPERHVGGRVRIEHWRLAEQHGRAAAASMAGRGAPFDAVPGFWTEQFGLRVASVGVGRGWSDALAVGDVAGGDFTMFYIGDEVLVAAAGTRDLDLAAFSELMRRGRLPRPDDLRGRSDAGLVGLL